jgi:hypothetical protein
MTSAEEGRRGGEGNHGRNGINGKKAKTIDAFVRSSDFADFTPRRQAIKSLLPFPRLP